VARVGADERGRHGSREYCKGDLDGRCLPGVLGESALGPVGPAELLEEGLGRFRQDSPRLQPAVHRLLPEEVEVTRAELKVGLDGLGVADGRVLRRE
jgi:hypothetical protein